MTNYVRLTKGLSDKGKLVPDGDIYNHLETNDTDYYRSVYLYNQDQYYTFQQTGSVAGVTDVFTNKVVFDFDDEANPDQSQADCLKMVSRLLSQGLNRDDFNVYFSGNKGFSIEFQTTHSLTPKELRSLAEDLAKDLPTFDTKVYNASRIFRVPFTKHNKTGLYKVPVNINQLSELTVDQIKDLASNLDNFELTESTSMVSLPDTLIKAAKSEKKKTEVVDDVVLSDLDFTQKPKRMPACKFAILHGHFKPGSRNHALMALAAHYKAEGVPREVTVRILEGSAELQAKRYKQDAYDSEKIEKEIIGTVYGMNWLGKTYSCNDHAFLKEICEQTGKHRCNSTRNTNVVRIESVADSFAKYAADIDKNTVKTGIKSIDRKVRLQTCSHVVLAGCSGSGKCLGKDTPILMFDGSIKMVQDIVIGDIIMGDDSTPRNILGTCKGTEPLYRINQTRGESYVVNASHIISVIATSEKTPRIKNRGYFKGQKIDINIEDYINTSKKFKKLYSGYRNEVHYPEKETKIDPYVLGYWLGNGTSAKPQFTCHVDHVEVIHYIEKWAASQGSHVGFNYTVGKSYTFDLIGNTENCLRHLLKIEGLYNNKHIPKDYLVNSRKKRLELLAGLIDSDGHLNKPHRCNYELTFKNKLMAEQIATLCRSLGYFVRLNEVKKSIKSLGFTGIYYRIYLNGDDLTEIPVKLSYKKAIKSNQQSSFKNSKLDIESIGEGEYFGFEIDGNKRFLLGDCTVTHNTTFILNLLNNLSKDGLYSLFGSMDMNSSLIFEKLAKKVTGLNDTQLYDLYKKNEKKTIDEITKRISEEYNNTLFDFRAGVSFEELRDNLLETKSKVGSDLKLVVLDFINRIRGPFSDETANLSYIAPKLSDLANETETLIVSLAQIARHKGGPNTPLTDSRVAKGSSAIEESATVLFGMWRPGYKQGVNDKYVSIAALKTRMSQEFQENLYFNGLTSEIRDLTPDEQKQYEHFIDSQKPDEDEKKGYGKDW